MGKTLAEYADWLAGRDLIWPVPPEPVPAKATPFLKPLPEVRAVLWNVYGTLLNIADGELLHLVDDPLRMEVALDKTVQEFNMWNSMYRKPGTPWELMFQQYEPLVADQRLTGKVRRGETAEINSAQIWKVLVERLLQKKYSWDHALYGELDDFCEKIAWFFHSALQGCGAAPGARESIAGLAGQRLVQGVVGAGQSFTLTQVHRLLEEGEGLQRQPLPLTPGCVSLSYELGAAPPTERLFAPVLETLQGLGIEPGEVLYISSRLVADLAPAKRLGLRTALYAGDKTSLRATGSQVRDPELQPDRILTALNQILQITGNR
ncbi:MAG TPA: HAD family hydrolase [Planctomycetaceae bacterium]|nr:HAD family hydrolase [Planctomycetaceae bacterium]